MFSLRTATKVKKLKIKNRGFQAETLIAWLIPIFNLSKKNLERSIDKRSRYENNLLLGCYLWITCTSSKITIDYLNVFLNCIHAYDTHIIQLSIFHLNLRSSEYFLPKWGLSFQLRRTWLGPVGEMLRENILGLGLGVRLAITNTRDKEL